MAVVSACKMVRDLSEVSVNYYSYLPKVTVAEIFDLHKFKKMTKVTFLELVNVTCNFLTLTLTGSDLDVNGKWLKFITEKAVVKASKIASNHKKHI